MILSHTPYEYLLVPFVVGCLWLVIGLRLTRKSNELHRRMRAANMLVSLLDNAGGGGGGDDDDDNVHGPPGLFVSGPEEGYERPTFRPQPAPALPGEDLAHRDEVVLQVAHGENVEDDAGIFSSDDDDDGGGVGGDFGGDLFGGGGAQKESGARRGGQRSDEDNEDAVPMATTAVPVGIESTPSQDVDDGFRTDSSDEEVDPQTAGAARAAEAAAKTTVVVEHDDDESSFDEMDVFDVESSGSEGYFSATEND